MRIISWVAIGLAGPVLISDRISPAVCWPAGFLSYTIPVFILLHSALVIYTFFRTQWIRLIIHTCILLLSTEFIHRTITFHTNERTNTSHTFSVLSYNVRVFNAYAYLHNENPDKTTQMIDWINEDESEIKCFQEFYNHDTSHIYNSIERLSQKKKYRYYFTKVFRNEEGAGFGIATFSKYPITHYGSIPFEDSKNKAMYTDIVIHKDTIRIINVHFQSIHINEEGLFSYENSHERLTDLLRRLKKGFKKRIKQLEQVEPYILTSPHPVILCGDLNDLPYSYTYTRLKKKLYNAFEESGYGTGFTYNGRLPFLRIDNQFFDPRLRILSFNTLNRVTFSDHYPIKATYTCPSSDGE